MPLFQKSKIFSQFFLHFRNLHKPLHIFLKNTSFIASIFWSLLTPRNVVTRMPESSSFKTGL